MKRFARSWKRRPAARVVARSIKLLWVALVALGLSAVSPPLFADDPLSLDQLLTQAGEWKITGGMVYVNGQDEAIKITRFASVEGSSGTVAVPAAIDEGNNNIDIVLPSTSVRYGFDSGLEIFTQLTGYWLSRRTTYEDSRETHNETHVGMLGVSVGASKRLYQNKHVGGLIAVAQVAIDEESVTEGQPAGGGTTWAAGINAYRVIDPLFLSISSSISVADSRTVDGNRVDPGDSLVITPTIGFAVNSDLTLTSALNWFLNSRDKVNGKGVGIDRTSTQLGFGVLYASSERWVSSLDVSTNISGAPFAQWSASVAYRFLKSR